MNAERLHAIAKAIRADIQGTSVSSHLDQLVGALQNQVSQPGQPVYEQQVSQFRQALSDALDTSHTEAFSPTWQQAIEEIGASDLLGVALQRRIDGVFSTNQITPSVALEELRQSQNRLQELIAALDQLLAAYKHLGIGAEELNAGECEVGVLIPRAFVDNRLDSLAAELAELDRIFECFAELSTGSRPGFHVRTISTTDFSVFIEAVPPIAACIAVAVERIVTLYKQLLEIRKLQGELTKQGLEKKNLKGIEEHANSLMESGIEDLVKQLLKDFYEKNDNARKNELTNELRFALTKIANRVDRGFNIDVRMEQPEEDSTQETDEPADVKDQVRAKLANNYSVIQGASENLQFLKLQGESVLSLPEANEPTPKK
jgi:hypothetical protein